MSIYYRTKDGQADYQFSFEQTDKGWRAYILSQPGYRGRDTDLVPTHRKVAGGRYYVCWTERLDSEEEARWVAARWADATQEYIRSGQRF